MKIINGQTLPGMNFSFGVKVIDIDFYNVTDQTLFLGYSGDNAFTQLHLIIPEEYRNDLQNNNWGVYASFYNDTLQQQICTISIYPNEGEYYLPLTNGDILKDAYKGKLQFFIKKSSSSPQSVVIASSQKIPYIVEESLDKDLSSDYIQRIEDYWASLDGIGTIVERVSNAESNISTLQNDIQTKANKLNNNTPLNMVLVSGNNGNYASSGRTIGGDSLSGSSSKLATEKGVKNYVTSEIGKLPTLSNGIQYKSLSSSSDLDSNTDKKYIYGVQLHGTYGLVLNSHVATHISQYFFSSLGQIKVRTKPYNGSWSEWTNYGVDEGETLTPEMVAKINAAITSIPDYVERNTNKKDSTYNYQNAEEDTTNYPSMAALWKFKEIYVDPASNRIDGLQDEITNLENNKLNLLNGDYDGQIPRINEDGELEASAKFPGGENFRSSGNSVYLATEAGVINYINEQNFASENDLEEVQEALEVKDNLIVLDTSLSDSDFTIYNNYLVISGGTLEGASLQNLVDGIMLDANTDYYIGFKSANNLDYTIRAVTNRMDFNINSSVIKNRHFFQVSVLSDSSLQFDITVNEDVEQNVGIYFYLFKSNDLIKKIISDSQSDLDRIVALEQNSSSEIEDTDSLVSFKEFKNLTDKLTTNSDDNFILLEDSKQFENGLIISTIGNYFNLNGTLTEETTFYFPVKNTYYEVVTDTQSGAPQRFCHAVFCDVNYNESNNILPIEGTIHYNLYYRGGTTTKSFSCNFVDDYQNNNISATNSPFGRSQSPYQNVNFTKASPGDEIEITVQPGTYNNENFYLLSQVNSNYTSVVISDILRDEPIPFVVDKKALPKDIAEAPDSVALLTQQLREIEQEIDSFPFDGTTLEDYNIEDAYTKEEVDTKEESFLEAGLGSQIALKNKTYRDGNITVEVSEWGTVHVYGSGEATITLDTIPFSASHYMDFIYIENDDSIEDNIVSLGFSYLSDTPGQPPYYTYELPNKEVEGVPIYPRMTSVGRYDGSFDSMSIVVADNDGIDYTFTFRIFDSNSYSINNSPVSISEQLTDKLSQGFSNRFYYLEHDKVNKRDLFTSYESSNLVNFVSGSHSISPMSGQLIANENEIEVVQPSSGQSAGCAGIVELDLQEDIILEEGKTYGVYFRRDSGSSDMTIKLLDTNQNIYKTYTLSGSETLIIDDIYVRTPDVTINKISCKIADGLSSGTYYLTLEPIIGIITEDALGLDRFVEDGEVNYNLKYSSSTAYKLRGTYRLKDGFCYITARADCYPGWAVMYYDLPVAPIADSTVLGANGSRLYEASVRVIHPDTQEACSLAITPIERKFAPNPDTNVYASGDPINITICYKYR